MSKGFTIEITGLAQTIQKLRETGDIKKSVISKAVKECAVNIAADAQRSAPVDMGGLRQDISGEMVTEFSGEVVSKKNYSAYVEFGTGGLVDVPEGLEQYAMTFKGKGIKQINLPPRPFFFPAVRKNEKILVDKLKIELNK